jgi:dihydrofolate reductase
MERENKNMKVVLYMAQTVNGMIARENYEEDFLSDESWKQFVRLAEELGCFIVGRKTYEEVRKWKEYNFNDVKANKIVVSHKPSYTVEQKYRVAHSPRDALHQASKLGFKKVLLAGGGTLNSAFMKENLIDELISEEKFEKKLKLMSITKLKSGIVQLRYNVKK